MCYNNAREQGCVVYAEKYPYEPDLGKTSVGSSKIPYAFKMEVFFYEK